LLHLENYNGLRDRRFLDIEKIRELACEAAAGTRQSYIEDCQVCSKPNVLRVDWDPETAEFAIYAELE
jgi:hypothetical protein